MAVERDVGQAVRLHRTRLGWTKARLAEAIQQAKQAISKIERGQGAASMATLEALARVFEIPIRDLLPTHWTTGSRQQIIDRIAGRLSSVPQEELERIEAVIEAVLRR